MKTTHLRAPIDQVLRVIDEVIASEGYLPLSTADDLPPPPENVRRRIAVAATEGWVAVADHPFAQTDWALAISQRIPNAMILSLDGECDHAFYSTIKVYRDGASLHTSSVPEEAVHEEDGRHRIRPLFLAEYFPEKKVAIEQGIVVNRLGGEENSYAVAEVLGVPNAGLTAFEDPNDALGIEVRVFVPDPNRPQPTPEERASKMRAMFTEMFDHENLQELGVDPNEMLNAFTRGLAGDVDPTIPLSLTYSSQGGSRGFLNEAHRLNTSFRLNGGNDQDRASGLTIRLSGEGLSLMEVTSIIIGETEIATSSNEARDPNVELVPYEDVPVWIIGKLIREGTGPIMIEAETEREMRATSRNTIEVKSALRVPALPDWLTKEDRDALRINEQHYLNDYAERDYACGWIGFDRPWNDVKDAVVAMVTDLSALLFEIQRSDPKPKKIVFEEGSGNNHKALLEAIDSGAEVFSRSKGFRGANMLMRVTRGDGEGDLCFDHYEEIPGEDDGFRVEIVRKGGERIEFPAPAGNRLMTANKILAELERGADVTLRSGRPYKDERVIEISHQPAGSNYYPDPEREQNAVRVQIAWSAPRPKSESSRIALGLIATDLLSRAGTIEHHLGGFAYASGSPLHRPFFDTPFEHLLKTRMVSHERSWLESHVRTPGYRVLVPAKIKDKVVPSPGITITKLPHGVLVSSPAKCPFDHSAANAEAVERALMPLLGEKPAIDFNN